MVTMKFRTLMKMGIKFRIFMEMKTIVSSYMMKTELLIKLMTTMPITILVKMWITMKMIISMKFLITVKIMTTVKMRMIV